jgi:hypothetical protein
MHHGTNHLDYSFAGEPTARAGQLKTGDQIPVAGAADISAQDAGHDTETGATEAAPSGPGPVPHSSGSLPTPAGRSRRNTRTRTTKSSR